LKPQKRKPCGFSFGVVAEIPRACRGYFPQSSGKKSGTPIA
jgi:hypothetical protein